MLHPSPNKLERDQQRLLLLQKHRQEWRQFAIEQALSRQQLLGHHHEERRLTKTSRQYASVHARQLVEAREWRQLYRLLRQDLKSRQQQELALLNQRAA